MTNSKKKGSRNERGIAHLFTDWTGYEFARTPQSGGLHWQKKITTGDIVCIDEKHMSVFTLSIECKFHEDLDFSHLIDGTIGKGTNKVIHFWDQCLTDAKKVYKIPCLFMRRNGMKSDMHFVALPFRLFMDFTGGYKEFIKHGYVRYFDGKDIDLAIVNSEDFFLWDYKAFHEEAKEYQRYFCKPRKILRKHGKEL